MDFKTLQDTPPWDWPEGTGEMLLGILRDDRTDDSDRLLLSPRRKQTNSSAWPPLRL